MENNIIQKQPVKQIRRGEIYFCNFGEENVIGSELKKSRPVLIVQNDIGNSCSESAIVVPLTSHNKTTLPTHYKLNGYGRLDSAIILAEQIKTISKSRLDTFLGALSCDDMKEVDKILQISLGIIPPSTIDI